AVPDGQGPAVGAEGDGHRLEPRLPPGPEGLAGRRVPGRDAGLPPGVEEPAPDGGPPTVRADGHRIDPPLEGPEGPPTAAGEPLADVDLRLIGLAAPRPVRRGARPRDEPRPVGAEGDGVDADALAQAQALAVTEPLDVVPFPAAAPGRATVEQVLG